MKIETETGPEAGEILCPLLKSWWLSALLGGHVHTMLSYRCAQRKNILTIVNIASAILVFLFSISPVMKTTVNVLVPSLNFSLYDSRVYAADIVTNAAAALVVISTMLQYYLRYEERHLEHRAAAVEYFNLSNKIRRVSKNGASEEDAHTLNTHLNFLNKGAPGLIRHPLEEKRIVRLFKWVSGHMGLEFPPPEAIRIARHLKEVERKG